MDQNPVTVLTIFALLGGLVFVAMNSDANPNIENLALRSSHGKTPEEKVVESGTKAPLPVQAGSPGNTLPPQPPPSEMPAPEKKHMVMEWSKMPPVVHRMFVGCTLSGNYLPLRDDAYFVLIQTPPDKGDIYGRFSLFVEDHKIGIKAGPRTVITQYNFDFRHHLDYVIEVCFTFVSSYHTRVELLVDKASTGIYFDIRNKDMLTEIRGWPKYVLMHELAKNAHLSVSKDPVNQWGSIIEQDLN